MSSIDQITLQGVRSFGPNEEDIGHIKFFHPLTLILGENGCGKTTIIEALKYACCGEKPVGDPGIFVYDPNLVSNAPNTVKGQVRLKFTSVKGDTMSITRTMCVEKKEKLLRMKTLDTVLNRLNPSTKSWESLPGRCADIDAEMCCALGVSKAVLCNVLFCHQEQAHWPLDVNTKVKEKFDEIFGAEKHNSCLDAIRILRKEYFMKKALLDKDLLYCKEKKEMVSKKRAELSDTENRMLGLNQRIETFESLLLPVQEKLRDLAQKEDKINRHYAELQTRKLVLENVRSAINDLKKSIKTPFQGTMDELNSAIRNFQLELEEKQNEMENLEKEAEDITVEINRNAESVNEENYKIGQLNRDVERNNEAVQKRNSMLAALSEDLGISTSISDLADPLEVHKVMNALEHGVEEMECELAVMKEEQKNVVAEVQREMDKLREEKAKAELSVKNKIEEFQRNRDELKNTTESLKEVEQSADILSNLAQKSERINREYNDLVQNNKPEELQLQLESIQSDRQRLEDELGAIERELPSLQALGKIRAEIDTKTQVKKAKDSEALKLMNRHENTLKRLLGDVPQDGIKFNLETRRDQLSDEINDKTAAINKIDSEIATLTADMKHSTEKLRSVRQNLETDEFVVKKAIKGKDYDEYLSELSNKVQKLQDERGTLTSKDKIYSKYVQKLKQRAPSCPLCQRDFSDVEEATKLVANLTLEVQKVPMELRAVKEDLDRSQEEYNHLLQLKPKHEKLSVTKNVEVPNLEREMAIVEKKLSQLYEKKMKLEGELVQPKADEDVVKSIISDIALLDQHNVESRKLGREIQKLESQMPLGQKRTLEEALKEQQSLRAELQKAYESHESLLKRRNDIDVKKNKLQEEKNKLKEQQLKMSGNLQMKSQLIERKSLLDGLDSKLQVEIDESKEKLAEVTRSLEQAKRQMELLLSSNSTQTKGKESNLRVIERKFQDVKELNQTILDYEMSGRPKRLETCKNALSTLLAIGDSLRAKHSTILAKCSQFKNDISSQKVRERELEDNLKLLTKKEEEKKLYERFSSLHATIGDFNHESILEERSELRKKEEDLTRDGNEAVGSRRELTNTISSIKTELETEMFRNADQNYLDKLIDIEVLNKTIADLDSYFNALEWALLSYHAKRMEHINRVVRELWQTTYNGNDIDYIKILADRDDSASATKRRNFKYRVVQVKCGVEMDMRGRCSAGQKVLACLIIRIALAEAFSVKCGILALDEPTTNLDETNIKNLCHTLENIVNSQRSRSNFQLIVITHDTHFIDTLSSVTGLDSYYKLRRDSRGKSKVDKINI